MLPTSNNDNDPPTWPDICVPSVIYWRKPETLTIRVRRSWRTERHIDSCDFLHAGLRAKCCHPTTLQEMKCFKCSKDGSPVKLVVQNHLAQYDPPRDLESYLFTIKTTCTSSRNHLHSTVVIVIDLPKHSTPIKTSPLQLRARAISSKRKPQMSNIVEVEDEMSPSGTPSPPKPKSPKATSSPAPISSCTNSFPYKSPYDQYEAILYQNWEGLLADRRHFSRELSIIVRLLRFRMELGVALAIALQAQGIQNSLKLLCQKFVLLHHTISLDSASQLCIPSNVIDARGSRGGVPPAATSASSDHNSGQQYGFCLLVSTYPTIEDARSGVKSYEAFVHNGGLFRNLLNKDLEGEQLLSCLAVVHNW
ncbi:hypothetical protein Pelo_8593 [Pelomyxa schiedti]|nr:hypothetical protein Pelo_8593 [Pelomyxa schiedti]